MITRTRIIASLAPLALSLGCGTEPAQPVVGLEAHSFAHSEWSEPINLGSVVNSAAGDNDPALAVDGLSLYFASDRPGGLGGIDIWVAKRASPDSPWEAPENLGGPINTTGNDGSPALSADGHLLFLYSNRPRGQGGNDIWMTRRASLIDDIGWETPVHLGPDVNTGADEQGPAYVLSDGGGSLYFNRATLLSFDMYRAQLGRDGQTRGPALPVAELNDPSALDAVATVRADGREILFVSTRPGGFGSNDIWVSTRRSVHDPWSPPENWGGPPLNTVSTDLQPDLSHDGRTLVFSSNRLISGSGRADLWMSTRTPSGH